MTIWKVWFAILAELMLIPVIISAVDDGIRIDELLSQNNDDEVFVGDMRLSRDQANFLYSNEPSKYGLASLFVRWPSGVVFYKFDESLDSKGQRLMREAMDYIENITSCIRFKVKDWTTLNYVLIKGGRGCSSKVGMRGGEQPLIIDSDLCSKGSVIHELLHTLGFLHMHTSNSRDDYIDINWNNIKEESKLNFKKLAAHVASSFETEYDYDSITHYSKFAFAKDRRVPTIKAKLELYASKMGQREEMSPGDILRLQRMYSCPQGNYQNLILRNGSHTVLTNENKNVSGLNKIPTLVDEDDMVLTKDQFNALYTTKAVKRNGLTSAFDRWPSGVLTYQINTTAFSSSYVETIHEAMAHISTRTCLRFVPLSQSENQDYVYITKGPGCSSEVGLRHIGKQMMLLNEKACTLGKIVHEFLHCFGMLHLHTANDRDNYVQINWSNIAETSLVNFRQFVAHVSMFSTPYDYDSIMHYSPVAFAKNRSIPTIIPLHPGAKNMGQRVAMSDGDITRVNRMYKCGDLAKTSSQGLR